MGLFERMMAGEGRPAGRDREVVLYHSPTCIDCHGAREFFAAHGVHVVEHDVTDPRVQADMERRFGRVATPAIVIGQRVFWGFEENREDIADLLGVPADPLPR